MHAPAEVVLASAGQGVSGAAAPAAVEEAGAAAEEAAAAPSAPTPGSTIGVSTPLSFTLILSHLDLLAPQKWMLRVISMTPSWDELQGRTEIPGLSQCPGPAAGQARQVADVEPRVSRRKLIASTRLTGYQREVDFAASYNVCTCSAALWSRPHTDCCPSHIQEPSMQAAQEQQPSSQRGSLEAEVWPHHHYHSH